MKSRHLNVAAIQFAPLSDWQANHAIIADHIAHATAAGSQLIVLPELHSLPYFCQTENPAHFALAEALTGRTFTFLSHLAQQHQCVIIGSIFEYEAVRQAYYNTCLVIDSDGSLAGYHRKTHIPYEPGYYEKYYFSPPPHANTENHAIAPIDTSIGKIGVLICWEQWFPELARIMALKGADILISPTAIGWGYDHTADMANMAANHAAELDAWLTIQRSHAIANHLPFIAVNRIGTEHATELSSEHTTSSQATSNQGSLTFWGNSFICDAQGRILAHATADKSQCLHASVNFTHTPQLRTIWPFFRDRMPHLYQALVQQTAITTNEKNEQHHTENHKHNIEDTPMKPAHTPSKNTTNTPIIIGHRGARGEAPENTLEGFLHAVQPSASKPPTTHFELDIRLTKDEHLVVIHDTSTLRTTGKQGDINALTLAQLRQYDARTNTASWDAPAHIVGLEEILAACPQVETWQFEVKSDAPAVLRTIADKLAELIEQRNLHTTAIVTSLDENMVAIMHSHHPHIQRGFVCEFEKSNALITAQKYGCNFLCIKHSLATPELIKHAHADGMHVSCWTVNDLATADKLHKMGIDSLITDYPSAFLTHFSLR